MPYPALRPVEAFPVEVEGGAVMVALRDPEGIAEEAVMLSPAAFFVASLLDGRHDSPQIRTKFAGQFNGHLLAPEEIEKIVMQLDQHGLLDSPTYRLRRADVRRRWDELRERPALLAGASYPAEPEALRAMLRGYLTAEGGPGLGTLIVPGAERRAPRGLVVPHIDFARGGPVYAHAHHALLEDLPPLVVVLGVAHAGGHAPFIATRKPFATPCGTVETDGDAVGRLAEACGDWLLEHEVAHRLEHSVEFQAVWLKALHPVGEVRIVPILCGPFEAFTGRASPLTDPRIAQGIGALKALVRERRALVLASVDLSHVGPKFGDEVEVDEALADRLEREDAALLAKAAAGDPEAFWAHATADGNARHVDALGAVYTLLNVLAPAAGRVLAYGQGEDPAGGLVSFAALAFEDRP